MLCELAGTASRNNYGDIDAGDQRGNVGSDAWKTEAAVARKRFQVSETF